MVYESKLSLPSLIMMIIKILDWTTESELTEIAVLDSPRF